MHSSNHKSRPSIASSLPGAASTSAAIRRGKLEISDPILMPPNDLDEPAAGIDDGRDGCHSSTSFPKTDTWPRSRTPPALQEFRPQGTHWGPVLPSSSPYHNTNRTSAAFTNTHQSMSSVPSGSSVRKSGGIRATFRRMFGSKRRSNTFSTGINDPRSVGDTDLHSSSTFSTYLQLSQADYPRTLAHF